MRIGIDARFLTHPQPGGFKTYVENLVPALAMVDTKNEYVLYLDRTPVDGCRLPATPNFGIRVVPGSAPVVGMAWREQVSLTRQAAKDGIELFHAPCLTAPLRLACPLVVTIHDMIWASPERFARDGSLSIKRRLMQWYYLHMPKLAMRRASAIITISQASKESIVAGSDVKQDRVFVTHEAASTLFSEVGDLQQKAAIRRKYELPGDFILAIGSADPRKNIGTLVEAYSSLPQELQKRFHLVIVWTHALLAEELSKKIEERGLRECVQFVQRVPTNDLVLLYNAASLFVFPSLYEGFGLPPLEAMASGTPVVASDNSSIPEIVGDAALLFDARSPAAISEAMLKALTESEAHTGQRRQRGLERARSFSWAKCATQTLNVYHHAMGFAQ